MNPQKLYRCLSGVPGTAEHSSLREAKACCGSEEELWECDECGNIYDNEEEAEECCDEEDTP